MRNIVVAITGASGAVYASLLLKKLRGLESVVQQVAVVMSPNAETVWQTELGNTEYTEIPFKRYDTYDFNAPFASGSGRFDTMIIIPCSMGTMGRIAQGISNDLVTRAADVILKERRRLICVVRETPYNLIHVQNMEKMILAGGIVCPATPSFYSKPQTVEEVAATVVDRVLDLADLPVDTFRWGGNSSS